MTASHTLTFQSSFIGSLLVTPRTLTCHVPNPLVRIPSAPARLIRCAIQRPERYDSTDWAKALSTLPRSVVLRRVRGHIIANSVVSSIVLVLYDALLRYAPDFVHHVNVTPIPHTFMVTAMSLLLVFRSNAAYDRFWEGRKLWGGLINISRTMARLCVLTMPKPHVDVAAKLITCYAYALMHHLQGRRESQPFEDICAGIHIPSELQTQLEASLTSDSFRISQVASDASAGPFEYRNVKQQAVTRPSLNYDSHQYRTCLPSSDELLERINAANNKPLEILLHLSALVKNSIEWKQWNLQRSGACSSIVCNANIERDKLEYCSMEMMEILGKCERIVRSPVPAAWNRHTSRLISLWTMTLPFVLVPIQGALCVPTVAVMSWVLFSIEEIGHLVEDPFRKERYSIPLDTLCETIRNDVMEQITYASQS